MGFTGLFSGAKKSVSGQILNDYALLIGLIVPYVIAVMMMLGQQIIPMVSNAYTSGAGDLVQAKAALSASLYTTGFDSLAGVPDIQLDPPPIDNPEQI